MLGLWQCLVRRRPFQRPPDGRQVFQPVDRSHITEQAASICFTPDVTDGHYSINKGEFRLPRFFRADLLSFDIDHPVFPRLLEHLYKFSKSTRVHAASFHSKKNSIENEPPGETS